MEKTMAKPFRDLREKMPEKNRKRAAARTKAMLAAMPLQELREARRLSQESLAELYKGRQSTISKLERRADMYVSTLRRYIQAMGGSLQIIARFPDGEVEISQFESIEAPGHDQPAST
jgi:transcriptional regulator with XRE-family HTH domain